MAKKPVKSDKKVAIEKKDGDVERVKPVERWIEEIDMAKENFKSYWTMCDAIVKKYKDADTQMDQRPEAMKDRKYNVLWSVMQTMQPLVYSDPPKVHVGRRHNDKDKIGRDAAMTLQRGITFELDNNELHDALTEARDDYLLTSRGVVWPKYKPYMMLRQSDEKTYVDDVDSVPESAEVKEDDDGRSYYHKTYEEKVYEEVSWEHVHYRNFLHGASAKWRHVPWVARMVPMTRKELLKRFDKAIAKKVPLTLDCKDPKRTNEQVGDDAKGMFAKAEVWEIWCKEEKKVYWVCPQYKTDFLDEEDDFLELDNFFPCPRPAFGTKTNESLQPTPDYKMWQDIALELDDVTWRIKLLVESLRVVGIYDSSLGDLIKRVTKQTRDNDMIGVESYAMLGEKGGLKGAIEFFPIEQVAAVLDKLYAARQRLIAELYDITGISDVVRGASDPRETAKAQQIKGNFANKRLSSRQNEMTRMADEALEIHAQIICKHYSFDTIKMISSAEQVLVNDVTQRFDGARFGRAMMLLKNNPLRRFRVKVDEKTLAMKDIMDDQEQRTQFVQGLSTLLGAASQMMEKQPESKRMLGEIILFAIRGFPVATSIEETIDTAIHQFMDAPTPMQPQDAAAPGTPPPTPQELAIQQGKNQIDMMKAQGDLEIRKRELDLRERELALKEKEIMLQAQNRERESTIREIKTSAETQIKAAQADTQRQQAAAQTQQAQTQQANEMMRWQSDAQRQDQQAAHQQQLDIRGADREDQRSQQDYELGARAQQFQEKNAARQAFQRGSVRQ